MDSSPYDVFGLPPGAPFTDVKRRYIKLAKRHHPDKLPSDMNECEKQKHADIFRTATVAYRTLEDIDRTGGSTWGADWAAKATANTTTSDDWASIFREAWKEIKKRYHKIIVPVSLVDVHNRKSKKFEIFLRDVEGPMYIRMNCGDYPKTTIIHMGHVIKVQFCLQDPVYHLDDVMGTFDLYTTYDITWAEYLTGFDIEIKWCDGITLLNLHVDAFVDLDLPQVIADRGLWGQGQLYIKLKLVCPNKKQWSHLSETQRDKIFEGFNALASTQD